jgi:4-aminobutyrate aminotransferase-like enzyme/Ser/Thr protein kinase RdoA (MazF antagonist)
MEISELNQILYQYYGLTGSLSMVYSELDAVYALTTESKDKYVIKISNPDRSSDILELESQAIRHLQKLSVPYSFQEIKTSSTGAEIVTVQSGNLRVLKWIDAELLSDCKPQSAYTRKSLGKMLGTVSKALSSFDSPSGHRFIKWDPSGLLWIEKELGYIPDPWKDRFREQLNTFKKEVQPVLDLCPKQLNYNDANDYNVLCNWNDQDQSFEAVGLIDFLDIVYTHRINELAIACSYAILKLNDPLKGAAEVTSAFHAMTPLTDHELQVLYHMILSRLMISVTVSAINKALHPENDYLQITDLDAWQLIGKWMSIHADFAYYSFRSCCGLVPLPSEDNFKKMVLRHSFAPLVSPRLLSSPHFIDLGVASYELGNFETYRDESLLAKKLVNILDEKKCSIIIGKYDEVRPIYTTEGFKIEGNEGPEWRTVHLGLDLFASPGTEVFSPCEGNIHSFKNNDKDRDYGPTIVIRHFDQALSLSWYTLYGHLSGESIEGLQVGDQVALGQKIGTIGSASENGRWPPHLHFQIILDMMAYHGDFPGVAPFDSKAVWTSLSPDPCLVTGIHSKEETVPTPSAILSDRKKHLGFNLSISYKKPLWIRRGIQQYLIDHTGRRYLDTVNNVAHCGHEHPRVVSAGINAMKVLNTNTRYLHENIIRLADQLTKKFDPRLSVCYFTNSGTEANELAIRLSKNYTGSKDFITMQWGYHGNSNMMVDLSSYKFDRKGGKGCPPNTHVIPMPDPFRGKYADKADQSKWYLDEVDDIIKKLNHYNSKPAALFAESILSCGGQVVYPDGFFAEAVSRIRKAGGLYIADEVQTGIGRIGSSFSAFGLYGVIPDIVTLGKPLGNGHPIGAVICTPEVAQAFNNGMEYFNTFGGNPVSCAIANEVLRVVEDEGLMENASLVGNYLIKEFNLLKSRFPVVADVRGYGLFLGLELMNGRNPATKQANYLTSRMKESGILMSTDGPDDNVIKIKPPMCFDLSNADELLSRIQDILKEHPFES